MQPAFQARVATHPNMMGKFQDRRLPLVNSDKRLLGIVSLGDFAVAAEGFQSTADAPVGISLPQACDCRW